MYSYSLREVKLWAMRFKERLNMKARRLGFFSKGRN